MSRLRIGSYEVRHALRLGQVHLPVKKGPLRELSGLGHSAARLAQPAKQFPDNVRRGMATDLSAVLTRIGMRRAEHAHHHLVQPLDRAVAQRIAQRLADTSPSKGDHRIHTLERLAAAHPDYSDSASRPCGRGAYGIL